MAKIKYIMVDEYFCTELNRMREMNKTHDYSGLASAIERLQTHGDAMESALYGHSDDYRSIGREVHKFLNDKEGEEKGLQVKTLRLAEKMENNKAYKKYVEEYHSA